MQHSSSFDLRVLVDPSWFKSGRFDSLRIEAYEMALAPPAYPRKIFRFNEIVVLLATIRLDFLELAGIKIKFGDNRQVEMSADHKISTSDLTPKLITIQPHTSVRPDDEAELANRSSEYVSLLVSTNYRNIAFRHLFTHIIGYRNDSMTAAGNLFRLPFDLPAPDLSAAALDRFSKCEGKIRKLPADKQQKITLSLHWHLKGVQSEGLDSFLSLWIALETLAMRSSNIGEINDTLASIYGTTKEAASTEFGIGRIFGLRSKVVHDGVRRHIYPELTDYMECLYADLLVYELLGEILGRARGLLASKKIDIGALTLASSGSKGDGGN